MSTNQPPLRVVIVDDETRARNVLRLMLQEADIQTEVVGEAADAVEAREAFARLAPDLVFLDISMPGQSGIELLAQLPEVPFQVIFVTAYNEHALRAFELSATDYVLKPVQLQSLERALHKAHTTRLGQLATNPTQLNALFAALGIPTQAPRLLIYTANGTHALDVSNILLLEAEGAYTTFHLKSGERIIASRVLREFEAQLPPQQFVRVHRSYLVRVSAIQSLQKAEEGSLRLTNGMLVPVARARRDDLLKLLQG